MGVNATPARRWDRRTTLLEPAARRLRVVDPNKMTTTLTRRQAAAGLSAMALTAGSHLLTPESINNMARTALRGAKSLAKKFKDAARRSKIKTPTSKSSKAKRKVLPARNRSGVALTKASSSHKGVSTNFAKAKNVVVTNDFKLKVAKALANKTISGSWDQISFDNISISSIPVNGQAVNGLGAVVAGDYSNWAFHTEDILHAASVLWNNKTDNQTSRNWASVNNLGYNSPQISAGVISDLRLPGKSTYPLNVKITVKRCHETYKLKNESLRTVVLKIYLCEPRQMGCDGNGALDLPSGDAVPVSRVTTANNIGNPGAVWSNELAKQTLAGMNMGGSTPQQLYNKPNLCPVFNRTYKCDETSVVLEPGQVYEYYIEGPSNLTINYTNFFKGSGSDPMIFNAIQKFMRYPLFTAYVDLVTDGTVTGRYPTTATGQLYQGIAVERQQKFFLEMPDVTGGGIYVPSGATVGAVENNYRRDCYFKTVYTKSANLTSTARDVNVQDPGNAAIIMDLA